MNFITKYIKNKFTSTGGKLTPLPRGRDITEPVYAIGKATKDRLNRWKFEEDIGSLLITDKQTGRGYDFDKRYTSTIRYLEISGYMEHMRRLFRMGMLNNFPIYTITLTSYQNVFTYDEKIYLEDCFNKLLDRKTKQALRVYDYHVYKAERRKQDSEKKSIKAGLEIRAKMLEEYK